MKTGIDKYCEDLRKQQTKEIMEMDFRIPELSNNYLLRKMGVKKKLPPLEPYREKTFEEQRYWIMSNDENKFKQMDSRLDFFKQLTIKEMDYYNFKMEELIIGLI